MQAEDFETELKRALEQALTRPDGQSPINLADSIRYSLLAPGKRIRPRLALATGKMAGLDPKAALAAGIAIEMVHCFTLIHDDLPCMDNDDFRRGRPSNHKAFGEAIALLAGDALIPLAIDALAAASTLVQPAHFLRALKRFAWASGPRGVIGGQAAEPLLTERSSLEELQKMHAMKTGALFSAAILMPMDLAGIPELSQAGAPKRGEALADYAAKLGLAFQTADDLEDDAPTAANLASTTSILRHLSPEQAKNQARASLDRAKTQLIAVWGASSSAPLTQIGDEVLK